MTTNLEVDMWGTSKGKIKQPETQPLPDLQRCEATTIDTDRVTHRCRYRGSLYRVEGGLNNGMARLCVSHVKTFERRGYKVMPATDLDHEQQRNQGA